ncbi:MAG: alpha/beta fold hydrolase [bacterium]
MARSLTLALLIASLFFLGCPKKNDSPSLKATGHRRDGGGTANGPSGHAHTGSSSTDDSGRRIESIEFLSNGSNLVGKLMLPAKTDPAPAVVLVHMLGSDKSAWNDIQELFADEGIATLAFDLNGHGDSEGGPKGFEAFSDLEWQAGVDDVRNAVDALKEFPDKINVERLAIMGASIGANYAILVGGEAGNLPVIAISAGKDYHGVDPTAAAPQLRRRGFFVAQTEDVPANDFFSWAEENAAESNFWPEDGTAHGTDIFPDPPLENQLLLWLRDRWGIQPGEPGSDLPAALPGDEPLADQGADVDNPPVTDTPPDTAKEDDAGFPADDPPDASGGEEHPDDDPPADGGDDDGGGDDDDPPADDPPADDGDGAGIRLP